jgi:hypothetical protein
MNMEKPSRNNIFEDKVKIKKKEIENKTFDNVRRSFNQMNIRDEEILLKRQQTKLCLVSPFTIFFVSISKIQFWNE